MNFVFVLPSRLFFAMLQVCFELQLEVEGQVLD
jgi:hypothetical protein